MKGPGSLCFVLVMCSVFAFGQGKDRHYFKKDFLFNEITRVEPASVPFTDMIPSDTLHVCFTTNKFPYAYFREVFTNVCNGGECLPVWLFIYWSPGGSFLGYELKDDNILTKDRHVPFTEEDYQQLHHLLALPESLLKNYEVKDVETNEQLETLRDSVAKGSQINGFGDFSPRMLGADFATGWSSVNPEVPAVDGVSGATDKEVKLFVVKGALYTTHTLWGIVYGATSDSVKKVSTRYLSKPFLDTLLASKNIEDNQFALSLLDRFKPDVLTGVLPQLQKFMLSDSYLLKESTLNRLVSSAVTYPFVYDAIAKVFVLSDFGTKQMILDRLTDKPDLSPEMIDALVLNLTAQNAATIQKVIKILEKQKTVDVSVKRKIAALLDYHNQFVARLAYQFLSKASQDDPQIAEKIRTYKFR